MLPFSPVYRGALLAALVLLLAAPAGCQSARVPASTLTKTQTKAGAKTSAALKAPAATQTPAAPAAPAARAMTDAERASLLADAQSMQNSPANSLGANILAGLDPTGLAQIAMDAERQRQANLLQRHMPAILADSRFQAERFCKDNPSNADCVELRRQTATAPTAPPARASSR